MVDGGTRNNHHHLVIHVTGVTMIVDMKELGGSEVLAGADNGRATFARLIASVRDPRDPELCALDYRHVQVATASFQREAFFAFKDALRSRNSKIYPVVANINTVVRDDIEEVAHRRGEVVIACRADTGGNVSDAEIIGELEPKQRLTLQYVQKLGLTDAATLMREHGEIEGITSQTAWNNRLSALAGRGLLIEYSSGRAKRYKLILDGVLERGR